MTTTNNKTAEQRVMDGSAWDEFCDGLKRAGKIVHVENAPDDVFNKAEGYRYLTRMLRAGLESFLEYGDPAFPEFRTPCHTTIKMGADNPDNLYQNCPVDPRYDYKISGTRGSVDYLGIGTVNNRYGSGGSMETDGFIDARDMTIDDDGYLEIIVSRNKQSGNWLPMGEKTNAINVRQTFQDRINEIPSDLKIERLNSAEDRPEPLSPEKLDRSLQGAVMFVEGATQMFENWAESFVPHTNEMPGADQAYCQSIGGDPNIYYFHSAWKLAADEVLVLHADRIPECQTWNFQLDNWWMESLDYRYHTIHLNKHTARYDADGGVTLVVSHTDPGIENWIETAGHNDGTMCWRWIGATEHPPVSAVVMKLADYQAQNSEKT